MADSGTVGTLRILLALDPSSTEAGARRSAAAVASIGTAVDDAAKKTAKLAPQAERMVKAFSGERLMSTANNLAAAVEKLGGAEGIAAGAAKLTASEQARANATVTAAIEKYKALGQQAPQALLTLEAATRKVIEATKDVSNIDRLSQQFGGEGQVQQANDLVAAIERIGGASKLTQTEQESVNRTLADAIAKYQVLGQTAPQELIALEAATRKLVQPIDQVAKRTAELMAGFSGKNAIAEAEAYARAVQQVGGVTKLTAQEQAAVNRVMNDAIAKYKALGQTAPKAMVDLEHATKATETATGGFTATVSGLGKSILTTAAGFFTAQAAFSAFRTVVHATTQEIETLILHGAAVDDVASNFEHLTAQAGRSGDALLGKLRAGTHNTIDDFRLMKTVNDDFTAGLRLTDDQLSLLARGAFALAQKNATDVATGLEAMNEALLTGRTRSIAAVTGRLNLTAAEEKYAKSIGTTREHLTEEGKLEATRMGIFDALAAATARLGEQTDGLDEKVAQITTRWTNFQNALGRAVNQSPVIAAAFDAIAEAIAGSLGVKQDDLVRAIAKDIDQLAINLVDLAKIGVESGAFLIKEFIAFNKLLGDTAQAIDFVRLALLAVRGPNSQNAFDSFKLGDKPGKDVKEFANQVGALWDTMKARGEALQKMDAAQNSVNTSSAKLDKMLAGISQRMIAASKVATDHASAVTSAGKATQGLTDDTQSLTQASAEEKAALKAYQDALDAIGKSSTALAPVQQETIRLLNQTGIGSDTIAKALKLTTDEVSRSIKAIELYGRQYDTLDQALGAVARSVAALTTEQREQIKTGLDAGLSVEEVTEKVNKLYPALHLGTLAVKELSESFKNLGDIRGDILSVQEGVFGKPGNFDALAEARAESAQLEFKKEQQISDARNQLAQVEFHKQQEIATALAGIAGRRAQADIELAKMRGASIQEVYSLERREARATLNNVLEGIQAEVQARELELQAVQDVVDASKAAGLGITAEQEAALAKAKADLEAQREIAKVQTQAAMEDFNLAQRNNQEAIRRTTNVWVRAWDEMRSTSDSTIASIARGIANIERQSLGNLGGLLFGLRDVDTEGLKRAADDAKKHFDEIKRSGKATADEIHEAFNEWRKKEDEANNTFAYRFKQLWHGIKQTLIDVLNDILKFFIESFIGGMIRAIASSRLGELIGTSISSGLRNTIGRTAPGALPWLFPGIGSGNNTNPRPGADPGKGAPHGPGIVPIPPTEPGGGGNVPTPPKIVTTSIDTGRLTGLAITDPTRPPGQPPRTPEPITVAPEPSPTPRPTPPPVSAPAPARPSPAAPSVPMPTAVQPEASNRDGRPSRGANRSRDKDLAQFAGFDNAIARADTSNPPGFHGLDWLLTRHGQHPLFAPFIRATTPIGVRKTFAPIQAFVATLGRRVESFHSGGVVGVPLYPKAPFIGLAKPMQPIDRSFMTASGGGGGGVSRILPHIPHAAAPISMNDGMGLARAAALAAMMTAGSAAAVTPSQAGTMPGLGRGEVLIKALVGESVLTRDATKAIGGTPAVDALNAGNMPRFARPDADLSRTIDAFHPVSAFDPMTFHTGGTIGTAVQPDTKPAMQSSAQTFNRNTYITVEGVLDSSNFKQLLREHGFDEISKGYFLNTKDITTNTRKALNK